MNNTTIAFLLTLCAGLATGLGGCVALFVKKNNSKFLCFSLGFSAGVMIYVSMAQLFINAYSTLISINGEQFGCAITTLSFFCGILLIVSINKFIVQKDNSCICGKNGKNLWKTGVFTAVAIALHNFPEGFASFIFALHDVSLALPLIVAIAIHNIPEGLAISLPMYYCGTSKKKAIVYSFLSGLTEPLGAIIGYLVLRPFLNDSLLAILFAIIAGIMIYLSLDELLPASRQYGEQKLSTFGLIVGMLVMATSIFLLI